MAGCGIIIPAEAKAQKMTLEILCYLAGKIDELQATVQAMHDDQLTLKAEAEEVLEQHRQSAETYFASFPDPCGDDEFDPCPFASLPVGTKRRDLDRGNFVFILPDGTIFRVNDDGVTAALPDGAVENLAPDEDYKLYTSDGRTFQLDPACANAPEPQQEPTEPGLPSIPPDPAQCEEPE